MAAKVLTIEAAKAAKIDVIENGKYSQVVQDTVTAMRANRRSGTASPKTLIISAAFDDTTYLAARNVQPALLITAAEVNTEQLLNFRKIVITNDGLAQIADRLAK